MQTMCDSSFLLRAVNDGRLMQQIRHIQADTCARTLTGGGQKNGKTSLKRITFKATKPHKQKAARQVSHIKLSCD